jgi:hypothetical protein
VVPVPFLGTTWRTRGAAYWWRRVGAVALFIVLLAFVGALAVGFTLGIVGHAHEPVRIALGVAYVGTAVPGFIVGRRRVRSQATGRPGYVPRTVFPVALIAFLMGPFDTGLVLAILLTMFGHDFMGERRAREVTDA